MSYPWEEESRIWRAFCKMEGWDFDDKHKQELFLSTRIHKDEYEWFRKGYLSYSDLKL